MSLERTAASSCRGRGRVELQSGILLRGGSWCDVGDYCSRRWSCDLDRHMACSLAAQCGVDDQGTGGCWDDVDSDEGEFVDVMMRSLWVKRPWSGLGFPRVGSWWH